MPRISQLTALTSADAGDVFAIVDVSASTTKKITKADLLKNAPTSFNDNTIAPTKLSFKTLRFVGSVQKITLNTVLPDTPTNYLTVTGTTTGGNLVIDYRVDLRDSGSGATRTGAVRVLLNGTAVAGSQITYYTANAQKDTPSLVLSIPAPAGSNTVILQAQADTAAATYLNQASLTVSEVVGN